LLPFGNHQLHIFSFLFCTHDPKLGTTQLLVNTYFIGRIPLHRLFKYGENGDGTGYLSQNIEPADFFIQNTDIYCHPSYIAINANAGNSAQIMSSASIWKVRRRTYFSNPMLNLLSDAGAPVVYEKVTEYQSKDGTAQNVNGRTEYTYHISRYPLVAKGYAEPNIVDRYLGWQYGQNILQEMFKKDTELFSPAKKSVYVYDVSADPEMVLTRKVYKRHNVISDNDPVWLSYENFGDVSYNIATGYKNISSKTDSIYSSEGIYGTKETYDFDGDRNMIRHTIWDNHGGKVHVTRSYPKSYSNNSGFIGDMKTNNLLSYPIEYVKYKEKDNNINIISGQVTVYKPGGRTLVDRVLRLNNSSVVPLSSFKFSNRAQGELPTNSSGNTSYATDAKYLPEYYINLYDNLGNPREVKSLDGAIKVYIWGYNHQYPILEITNATYSEILTVLTQAEIDNLNIPNHTEAVMETLIKNAATKLRNHVNLSKAMVTNYTYKPLVGMTSKSDARGVTEYYQYDGMQRLKAVLDQFKDVTRAMDYHYRPN